MQSSISRERSEYTPSGNQRAPTATNQRDRDDRSRRVSRWAGLIAEAVLFAHR